MNTDIIIFSKNRTLQLKSLLLSLKKYSDIPMEEVNILFVESVAGVSYEPLKKAFPCKFHRQNVFLNNIRDILTGSKNKHVFFMVDDLIFRDDFSLEKEEAFLDAHPEVECFSHRMGRNIGPGPLPEFKNISEEYLVWKTSRSLGKHWNYFWEVSSSIYRKPLVLEYLEKCKSEKVKFPNPFEYHYYSCMPSTREPGILRTVNMLKFPFSHRHNVMACYERSKCFTQGVNTVAKIDDPKCKELFDPLVLQRKMEEGYVADYVSIRDAEITSPNFGPKYFNLVKEDSLQNA